MSFVSSSDTITIKAYLTKKGKQLYFNGDDEDIKVKYVTFGDSDINYFISSSINLNDLTNKPTSGFIPDLSGDDEKCIYNLSDGVDIKHKIKATPFKKDEIINQYCQPPYTLIEEISNGDGTSYFRKTENSPSCGFSYKSNIFSRSFIKQTCTGNSIGQSYTVSTTFGQFTGLTQSEADNKAIQYLNLSGQSIANQNGSCLFSSSPQQLTFEKNDCPNGGRPYVVSTNQGQFTSLISQDDANNKALIYLSTNGQQIANQNGECKVLVNSTYVERFNSNVFKFNNTPNQDLINVTITQNNLMNIIPSIGGIDDIGVYFKLDNINYYNKNIKISFIIFNVSVLNNNIIVLKNNSVSLNYDVTIINNDRIVYDIYVPNYQMGDIINLKLKDNIGNPNSLVWSNQFDRIITISELIDIYN